MERSRQPYREIDVSGWPLSGDETLGTKPKRWLSDPETGQRWLMKDVTFSERHDGTSHAKGDDWSERVANGIAGCLGLPAACTELALRRTAAGGIVYGIISRSVLSADETGGECSESLLHGNELLETPVAAAGRSRAGYTVAAARDALEGVRAPDSAAASLTAWDVFVGYLILDALVGNTDRHEENWAVIARGDRRALAPTFDHASCLGFMLGDDQRSRRLSTSDRGFTPEAYADRARSPFDGKPHPIDASRQAMAISEPHVGEVWISRCEDEDRLVEPVWSVPDGRMSSVARCFAERVLRRNRRRLLGVGR